MVLNSELVDRINKLLVGYDEMKNKILSGDVNALRQIPLIVQKGISPDEVVYAFDNNTSSVIYDKAKKLIELQQLYIDLCDAYYEEQLNIKRK